MTLTTSKIAAGVAVLGLLIPAISLADRGVPSNTPTPLSAVYDATTHALLVNGSYASAPVGHDEDKEDEEVGGHKRAGFAVFTNDASPDSAASAAGVLDTEVNLLSYGSDQGVFGKMYTSIADAPAKVCVAIYDVHVDDHGVPTNTTGGDHSTVVAGPTHNPDNSYDKKKVGKNDGSPNGFLESECAAVSVVGGNQAPVANALSITTAFQTATSSAVTGTDADSDTLTFATSTSPAHGTLVFSTNGTFTYTPAIGYHGSDSFMVIATDTHGAASAPVTVAIIVNDAVVEPPVCNVSASQTIVSDTATLMGAATTVSVSPINGAWTAIISGATWIWGENPITNSLINTAETFTRNFTIVGTPTGATLMIAADNTYTVSVNGHVVGSDLGEFNFNAGGQDTIVIPAEVLVSGVNTISFTVTNIGLPNSTPLSNPAGLLYKLTVTNNECVNPPASFTLTYAAGAHGTLTGTTPQSIVSGGNGTAVAAVADAGFHFVNWSDGGLTATRTDLNVTASASYTANFAVNESEPTAACSDGIDNDQDGRIDTLDPQCHSDGNAQNPASYVPSDTDESGTTTQCNDGLDNDNHEDIDATDPQCHTDGNAVNTASYDSTINNETAPVTPVDVCSNIEGNQATVPEGMTATDGVCTTTPVTPPVVTPPSGGGGHHGGGGGGCASGFHFDPTTIKCVPNGQVAGVTTTGQVLGASCGLYMDQHLKKGSSKNNTAQVKKLQEFLVKHGFATFAPNGNFGALTEAAVKAFQQKYAADILTPWNLKAPTGLAYLTTLRTINLIECPDLMIPTPALVPWSANPKAQ
jgi:hypothetical protein